MRPSVKVGVPLAAEASTVNQTEEERVMLNWKVVTQSLASFTAISFALCVGYGLLAPPAFHPSWLLEAVLPGFKWLGFGSFLLGLVESTLYGAGAGILYSALYNYFARGAAHDAERRLRTVRAA
jgi:hypothetical protein